MNRILLLAASNALFIRFSLGAPAVEHHFYWIVAILMVNLIFVPVLWLIALLKVDRCDIPELMRALAHWWRN
jgi:hypothetical protein